MSRRKIILGAVALVMATVVLTTSAFVYVLHLYAGDAASTLRLFRAMQIIKSRYVENASADTLLTGAIKGMVSSLGDPHSIYMDPKMFKDFMVETEGSFGGVGIVLGAKEKVLTVVSPIEGTPGEKAGIKSGDSIIKINGQDTKTMALDEAVSKIRGPEGTQVTLTILRGQDVRDYTMTRSSIKIKTVNGKMLADNIGYMRISMFNEQTHTEFIKKYQELEKEGMQAIILDLRDNPGGLLDESVKVANKFVPKGPVVSVITRDGRRDTSTSNLDAVKYPCVVLVNGGSASASEIVAGAIQDTEAGTLVGTKTFGKGSVQTIMRLDGGAAIKLTIAKYYTPNGRSINGVGIEPDVKVDLPEKLDGTEMKDTQLDKALEIVKSKMQ